MTLDAGAYSVNESGGLSGYSKSLSPDCDGSIALGESKTCTIPNHDIANNDPPRLSGRMTGGGSIQQLSDRVTHCFELNCQVESGLDNLEVNWGSGNRFHLENLTWACPTGPT